MASRTQMRFAVVLAAMLCATGVRAQSATAVHVVTYLDLAPQSLAKARPLLQLYRDAASKAAGNSGSALYQEIGRNGRIVIRETWSAQASFDAHAKASASTALASGLKPLQLAPPDQRIHLDFASGAGPAKTGSGAIQVFTHVDVPPPRQAELEPMLKSLQTASVTPTTAVRFEVLQQSNRKNHFTVAETWTSRKALDTQALAPAQLLFRDRLGAMLGALYDQRLYRPMR